MMRQGAVAAGAPCARSVRENGRPQGLESARVPCFPMISLVKPMKQQEKHR